MGITATGMYPVINLQSKASCHPSRREIVDDAMQLVLRTREMTGGVPGILRLQGEGTDLVGHFVIEGLARDTGVVKFRKQYIGRHCWWYTVHRLDTAMGYSWPLG